VTPLKLLQGSANPGPDEMLIYHFGLEDVNRLARLTLVERNLLESHFGINRTLEEHDFVRTEFVRIQFWSKLDFG
jgi:hypothetical protein